MQLLKGLGEIQLKAVSEDDRHDASAPKLTGYATEAEVSTYQHGVLDCNLERYAEALGARTFASELVPLTQDDARLFVEAYETLQKQQQQQPHHQDKLQQQSSSPVVSSAVPCPLPKHITERMTQLEASLEPVIARMAAKSDGNCVFVKTSCRSAKDSGVLEDKCSELFHQYLQKQQQQSADGADGDGTRRGNEENDCIAAALRAGTDMLRVRTASQALNMLMQSERIYQDMKMALMIPERFEENIVVRQWQDIDVDMEFRGFVCNSQLTALSQYNHLVYFPRLIEMRDDIVERVTRYFENEIEPLLTTAGFHSYVVDFALVGKDYKNVVVIELNPFLDTTDGCCFSWEKERHLLQGDDGADLIGGGGGESTNDDGKGPSIPSSGAVVGSKKKQLPIFRLRQRPMRGASALMERRWRALIDSGIKETRKAVGNS